MRDNYNGRVTGRRPINLSINMYEDKVYTKSFLKKIEQNILPD